MEYKKDTKFDRTFCEKEASVLRKVNVHPGRNFYSNNRRKINASVAEVGTDPSDLHSSTLSVADSDALRTPIFIRKHNLVSTTPY